LHAFERAVRTLKLDESEGQLPECEFSTFVGGTAGGVREFLQAGLFTYVNTLEKATTLRAFDRDRARRLLPELEFRQALETVQSREKKILEAWEKKGWKVEDEITEYRKTLMLDRQDRLQVKKGLEKTNHIQKQNELGALDRMTELAKQTRMWEKRLDTVRSRLAWKDTQVPKLERDLRPLEQELEKQEQRVLACRERRERIRQLQQNLHSLD